MYPGFQFPAKTKVWQNRLKTTEESFALTVLRVQALNEKGPAYLKSKKTVEEIEKMSMVAAFIVNVTKEVLLRVPIDDAKLQHGWVRPWSAGCPIIDQECQNLLAEKSELMDPVLHVPTILKLVDLQSPCKLPDGQIVKSANHCIEADDFYLFIKKIQYDVKAFNCWLEKLKDAKGAIYHAELDWKRKRLDLAHAAVQSFMDQHTMFLTLDEHASCEFLSVAGTLCWSLHNAWHCTLVAVTLTATGGQHAGHQ